jgi:hypothetical protein
MRSVRHLVTRRPFQQLFHWAPYLVQRSMSLIVIVVQYRGCKIDDGMDSKSKSDVSSRLCRV